jgi:hypothetical protein
MRRGKKSFRLIQVCLLSGVLAAGCAPVNGHRGLPPPGTTAQTTAPQYCPSSFNRARAGGTVGNVVGFIAASALGSPLLGILYSVGGYAVGFASADNCRKDNGTAAAATAQTSNGSGPVVPVKIAEEDLQ